MQKILVTGSEGFIGKNLCKYLSRKGFEVEGYDTKYHQRFPVLNGFHAVIHLGANSSTTEKNLQKILRENFEQSRAIYELCSANDIKFQYASSASVYGADSGESEEDFCVPRCPYAFSKYMFDCWLLNQKHPYQGFRYFNVYGQGEEEKGDQASPIHKFVQQAKNNKIIKIFEHSDIMIRDFVHVEDVCEIHHRMLYSAESGVFNVGTGVAVSFKEIAEQIARKYQANIEEIPMPEHLIRQYQFYTQAGNSKIQTITGFTDWQKVDKYIKESI